MLEQLCPRAAAAAAQPERVRAHRAAASALVSVSPVRMGGAGGPLGGGACGEAACQQPNDIFEREMNEVFGAGAAYVRCEAMFDVTRCARLRMSDQACFICAVLGHVWLIFAGVSEEECQMHSDMRPTS